MNVFLPLVRFRATNEIYTPPRLARSGGCAVDPTNEIYIPPRLVHLAVRPRGGPSLFLAFVVAPEGAPLCLFSSPPRGPPNGRGLFIERRLSSKGNEENKFVVLTIEKATSDSCCEYQ